VKPWPLKSERRYCELDELLAEKARRPMLARARYDAFACGETVIRSVREAMVDEAGNATSSHSDAGALHGVAADRGSSSSRWYMHVRRELSALGGGADQLR